MCRYRKLLYNKVGTYINISNRMFNRKIIYHIIIVIGTYTIYRVIK